MICYLDISVLVASLLASAPEHLACDLLLKASSNWTSPHALNETFSTLTGGRLGMRVEAELAAKLIREGILPSVRFIDLSPQEIIDAQAAARSYGVRGGAIYDFMHLVTAKRANADIIYTLNFDDFENLAREADPQIARP